jgi:hypothetical protein
LTARRRRACMMPAGIKRLHKSLVDANIKHVFYESPGTAHEWRTWRRDLNDFPPRLFRVSSSNRRNCRFLRRERDQLHWKCDLSPDLKHIHLVFVGEICE